MSGYIINKGMVLVDICGTGVLVATKAARKECPYMIPFNDVAVSFWKLMEQETPFEEIINTVTAEYEVEDELVRKDLKEFMQALAERNCLTML